jgi:hypothetical protein
VRGNFRRDLELAPESAFRLRRRRGARVFSTLLALAAVGWGAFDLWMGYRVVGAATVLLALAFVVQLLQSELDSWRFDGATAVRRTFVLRGLKFRELRLRARDIRGVEIAFAGGRARAWIEDRSGEQYALVEGDEREVRRIADKLVSSLQLAEMEAPRGPLLH